MIELAIFGGKPRFPEPLHVGKPNIGNRENLSDRIDNILNSGWLTNHGPVVKEFEERIKDYLGVRNCITVCNGTVALEIAIRALELKGEVIVPSFTFIAVPHSLQWQEITPVFADIKEDTFNIDPDSIERLITERTTGIIGVHTWGRPCNIGKITKIAEEHNLKVIYDGSHAFSTSLGGTKIGNFGDAEVFSFHATKLINTFEGGIITTNNDDLARKIRLMTNFGFAGMDRVVYLGTNGKMSEISAAMGLTSFESMDEFIKVNKENFNIYRTELDKIDGINIVEYDDCESHCYQYVTAILDESLKLSRDDIFTILHSENVLARKYFYPGCHRMEPYMSLYPEAYKSLKVTENISERVLCFPTGGSITGQDITQICEIIRYSLDNSEVVLKKLREEPEMHSIH